MHRKNMYLNNKTKVQSNEIYISSIEWIEQKCLIQANIASLYKMHNIMRPEYNIIALCYGKNSNDA